MKKSYRNIRFQIPERLQEVLIARLLDFGFIGFQQKDEELEAWIGSDDFTDAMGNELKQWLYTQPDDCRVLEEQVCEERNWNTEWEKTIRPQIIGRFCIRPTWSGQALPEGIVPITIDPKMTFGTGYHETTRLMLQMIPGRVRPGARILDVGTGTGVLAIAALKSGGYRATGIDIDPWSYDNAMENAQRNDVKDRFDIRTGSVEILQQEERFDLVLANINTSVLLDLADMLIQLLSMDGYLLISGMLEGDGETILNHPAYSSLELLETARENEWVAMGFRKRRA